MTDLAKIILKEIINCQISLYTVGPYVPAEAVVPISNISYLLENKFSLYKIRKALKELKEEGLIEYKSQGQPDICSPYTEDHYPELVAESGPPINGYALTKKGYESTNYKEAEEAFNKSLEEFAK